MARYEVTVDFTYFIDGDEFNDHEQVTVEAEGEEDAKKLAVDEVEATHDLVDDIQEVTVNGPY